MEARQPDMTSVLLRVSWMHVVTKAVRMPRWRLQAHWARAAANALLAKFLPLSCFANMDEEAARRHARKAAYEDAKARPPARKSFTPEELKTCMRVLNIVAQQDDESDAPPEVEEVRQQLAAIAKAAHRRNRRKERGLGLGLGC